MKHAYLEIIQGVESGKRFPVRNGPNTIGRDPSNTISLNPQERSVSSHHAVLYYSSTDVILIQDNNSKNGIYVNGDKITNEKELTLEDVVGFGKMGPKARIVVVDEELSQQPSRVPLSGTAVQPESGSVFSDGMMPYNPPLYPPPGTEPGTISGANSTVPQDDNGSFFQMNPSYTYEISKKLMDSNLSAHEFDHLLRNEDRVERILDSNQLDHSRKILLKNMFVLGKNARKRWMIIVSIITSIFIIITIGLSIQMFHYKNTLNRGLLLESQLDLYEKKIFNANKNPDSNKEELSRLIQEFDTINLRLSSIKGSIKDNDHEKFYMDETERFIDELMVRFGETNYHIPPKMVERVKYHIKIFSTTLKPQVTRFIKRKATYMPMIEKVLKTNNLPPELGYIAMLESGFNPRALSKAGAYGLWQFMPKTARQFGLRVDDKVDERCDPVKATHAAIEYFKDLIGIFGGKSSVMFAMAAYNAGEGRVMQALRKIDDPFRNRDFWYIYRMGYLAEETNEYIPRVLALMIIDKDPTRYGFPTDTSDIPQNDNNANDLIDLGVEKQQ